MSHESLVDMLVVSISSLTIEQLNELRQKLGWSEPPDIGVREPRPPRRPSDAGAVALEETDLA